MAKERYGDEMIERVCVVIDANDGPCVRALFGALAGCGWRVALLRVVTPGHIIHNPVVPFKFREIMPDVWGETVVVPGYRRFARQSDAIISWRRKAIESHLGKPDIVFYTMPRYSELAEKEKAKKAYFAYDPYKLYHGWDYEQTELEEGCLLDQVDAAFAVSKEICNDWKRDYGKDSFYMPNAVSGRFIDDCVRYRGARPAELREIKGKIVGCVGSINTSYDWVLIEKLSMALPEVTFVFIGEVTEVTPQIEDMKKLANVVFTGWVNPVNLAENVAAFDVCLNPLQINEMNNRRCPLRLYAYLASASPVVSSAISEALELSEFVYTGRTHDECIELVRQAVDGELAVDESRRLEFVRSQIWEERARQLSAVCEDVVFSV